MTGKTTSLHLLNADRQLSPVKLKLWHFLNVLNNQFPCVGLDSRMERKHFRCSLENGNWERSCRDFSPPRKLSDLFWMTAPWEKISAQLGELNILDIGCGSGRYAEYLIQWSGLPLKYDGYDVSEKEGWVSLQKKYPDCHFRCFDGRDFEGIISERHNLFISESALEHVEHDLQYFQAVRQALEKKPRPSLHIHLVPSSACLSLFRGHGIRQYTPRTLSKITRLFSDSRCTLYYLGGSACNRLHYQFITLPSLIRREPDWRTTKLEEYDRRLMEAIAWDFEHPGEDASILALVMETGLSEKLF